MILPGNSFSQEAVEAQEIPEFQLTLNEIKDIPVQNLRNTIMTVANVVEIQSLPNGILRLKAKSPGITLIYIFDSTGRRTVKIQVSNFAQSTQSVYRPGYDPQGTEFSYHTAMNNQVANGTLVSPYWNHDFTASIPIHQTNEWRTLISATTNPNGLDTGRSFYPFSSSTYPNQLLTYYRTPHYTAALGDVNYNPGELSITSFPLRGASFELYETSSQDHIEVFAGENRPQLRTDYIFNDPPEKLLGFAGAKEIFPNVILKTSFVYLDQPSTFAPPLGSAAVFVPGSVVPLLPGQNFKNDFVADVGLEAHPLTDEITLEGEFGKSSDDNSQRVLAEYAPYWGRIFVSYKRIGRNYVQPASFYLLKNYRETTFITDYRPTKKLSLSFNYQLTLFGPDSLLLAEKNTVNRFSLSSFYQVNESTSYITSGSYSHSESDSAPQDNERMEFTYQKTFKETGDQLYAQVFQQYQKTTYLSQYTRRAGGGTDLRYSRQFSNRFNGELQTAIQLNEVKSTFSQVSSDLQSYLETVVSWGPTVNYTLDNKIFSAGLYENFTFRDDFQEFSHFILPFGSAYYNPSQALSFGTRVSFNIDPGSNYSYLSVLAEMIYKFGTRVPDTLLSSFRTTGHVEGVVFEDDNNDGEYEPGEKIISGTTTQLNSQGDVITAEGRYKYKVKSGENTVMVTLPKQYENYQFMNTNPTSFEVANGETKTINFGINRRIPVFGKVVVREIDATSAQNDFGFTGAHVEIAGENYKDVVETSPSGVFNTNVPQPGKYKAKLILLDLPMGYRSVGSTTIEFTATEGSVAKLEPIVLSAKRIVAGRVFIDLNTNGLFDDDDTPIGGINIQLGNATTVSEEDGSFSISTLKQGIYKLKVQQGSYKGYRLNLPTDAVSIPEAGTVQVSLPYQK